MHKRAREWRLHRILPLLLCACFARSAMALTQIDFISDPGDYVGAGLTFSLTPADGSFTPQRTTAGVQLFFNGNVFVSPKSFWLLWLEPISGRALVPGIYAQAQRAPFKAPTHPGLDISGDGRGCNEIVGVFTIYEANYDNAGNVLSLAADAVQYCKGASGALRVRIRYNSTVPLVTGMPQAVAGLPQEVYERTLVSLDGSQSFESGGQIVQWTWSQVSGPPLTLESTGGASIQFRAPDVPPGGADVQLRLDVADAFGKHATDTVTVHVFDRRDRRNLLTWRSPQGDFIGGGTNLSLTAADFGVPQSTVNSTTVNVSLVTDSFFSLHFAAIAGGTLLPGTYLAAERWPFQSAGHPGLDVSGQGRGCNQLTGQFTILELNGATAPPQFGARFVQSCEGTEPPLRGTVLLNAIAPGNPVASIAGPSLALPNAPVRLDGSGSTSTGSALVAFKWRQLSGPAVTMSDPAQPILQFTMPSTSASLRFELEVTDEDGLVDVANITIASIPVIVMSVPATTTFTLVLLGTLVAALGSMLIARDRART